MLLGHLNYDGTVSRWDPDPRRCVMVVGPEHGHLNRRAGSRRDAGRRAADDREVNVVHLAWDVMVGLGTLLFLLALWYWAAWIFRRDMPRSRWFLRIAAIAGVLAVITLEAGWTVSEVGRQPWIVYEKMRVDDAATANTGVWITFIVVGAALHRARRDHDPRAARDEPPVPATAVTRSTRPTCPTGRAEPSSVRRRPKVPVTDEHRSGGHPVRGDHGLRGLRRRRLRRRVLGSRRRGNASAANGHARSSTTRSPRSGRRTTSG